MPVLDMRRVVKVCTVHRVAMRSGKWARKTYSKAMMIRHDLQLREDACPYCLHAVKQSFQFLWNEKEKDQALYKPQKLLA